LEGILAGILFYVVVVFAGYAAHLLGISVGWILERKAVVAAALISYAVIVLILFAQKYLTLP
jgi:hypothetical protein